MISNQTKQLVRRSSRKSTSALLDVIQSESRWWFTSFGHELAKQTVSVTRRNQSRTFSVKLCAAFCAAQRAAQFLWHWQCVALLILMTRKENMWSFRCSVQEDMPGVVLWTVVANCQQWAFDFLEGPVNLIKMHLHFVSRAFLICDTHMWLLWWNIAVGKFAPKPIESLTIALLLTSCWWCDKHVSQGNKQWSNLGSWFQGAPCNALICLQFGYAQSVLIRDSQGRDSFAKMCFSAHGTCCY